MEKGRQQRKREILSELALNDLRSRPDISGVLRVNACSCCTTARGLIGILLRRLGGAPRKLTAVLILHAPEKTACDDSRALAQTEQSEHPDASSFCLSRLSVGLSVQDLSNKHNRRLFKKSEINNALKLCKRSRTSYVMVAKKEDAKMELLYFDEAGVYNVPNIQSSWSTLKKISLYQCKDEAQEREPTGCTELCSGNVGV